MAAAKGGKVEDLSLMVKRREERTFDREGA